MNDKNRGCFENIFLYFYYFVEFIRNYCHTFIASASKSARIEPKECMRIISEDFGAVIKIRKIVLKNSSIFSSSSQ